MIPPTIPLVLLALVPQSTNTYAPNHPRIACTEYVCAEIDGDHASFTRELDTAPYFEQEFMSPGARASFRTRATHVKFELDYLASGPAGNDDDFPLSWEFGLEIDGVLRTTGSGNPLYPSTLGCGTMPCLGTFTTPWVPLHALAGPGAHDVSLIWPDGADVDLIEVRLKGDIDDPPTLLTPVPARPSFRLGALGDSITQGLYATHVSRTYPALLAAAKGWSVVNLGYGGRKTVPEDAWTAAGVGVCSGTPMEPLGLLILAIGSNDYGLAPVTTVGDFTTHYGDWIKEFRDEHRDTPILCITPIPRGDECAITTRWLEDYRAAIRAVLVAKDDPEIYLFEGRDLVRPLTTLFVPDHLHPNDAGFAEYADNLGRFNLARNAGFELKPVQTASPCSEVTAAEPYLWDDVGASTSAITTSAHGGARALSLAPSASRSQTVFGLSANEAFTLEAYGRVAVGGETGRVTLSFLSETGTILGSAQLAFTAVSDWEHASTSGTAPTGTRRARLLLSQGVTSTGVFLVDDLVLTVGAF